MAVLTSSDSSVVNKRFVLGSEPAIIGRHPDCDVPIDDGSVSRHHAQVTLEEGQYFVQDLNSRNGTYLNNQQINQPTRLFDQSEIRICDVALVFNVSEALPGTLRTPQPTAESESKSRSTSSVLIDDFAGSASNVMSELEVPSHYTRTHNHVGPEEKLIALTKIMHALSESVERDEVLAKILDFLFQLFTEADRGFIILKGDDGRLEPLGFKTRRPGDEEMIRISRTIVNQVMDTKRAIISSDAASDDRFDMSQSIVDFRIRSIMCAPLINSKDESIGVIQLDTLKQSIAFKEEDLETLVTVAMQASFAIQKSDLFDDVQKADAIRTDLALAHEIQQRFLPQHAPESDQFDFFSYYRPMQQVGGDYFDYVQLDEHRVGVIVADVVGHGIAAALLMAKVAAESRFSLATSQTAVEAISKMNNSLSGLNIDRFVTLVLGLLDTRTGRMTIVNAGHMPPILRKSANGEIIQLAIEEAGLPLGIMEDFEYESIDVEMGPGDIMVMYTDGINEAMNADGEQLSTERMIQEMKEGQAKTPENVGKLICQAVNTHAGREPAIDDMCIVCIGRVVDDALATAAPEGATAGTETPG
jgi:sigma-B regulation protein RsbU (phosphoserine phosphatase)